MLHCTVRIRCQHKAQKHNTACKQARRTSYSSSYSSQPQLLKDLESSNQTCEKQDTELRPGTEAQQRYPAPPSKSPPPPCNPPPPQGGGENVTSLFCSAISVAMVCVPHLSHTRSCIAFPLLRISHLCVFCDILSPKVVYRVSCPFFRPKMFPPGDRVWYHSCTLGAHVLATDVGS